MENNNMKYLIAGTGGVEAVSLPFFPLPEKDVTCIARGEHRLPCANTDCVCTPT